MISIHKGNSKNASRGVTLIELIMVMIVLAIVAGVTLPYFMDALPEARLQAGGDRIFAALAKARSEAATYGVRTRVVLDLEEETYQVVWEPRPLKNPDEFEAVGSSWDVSALPEGIDILEVDGFEENSEDGTLYLEFRADGTAAKDAKITLQNTSEDKRVLTVKAVSGQVRYEDPEEEEE